MPTITNTSQGPKAPFDWGEITWLCNSKIDPEAQMTFGVVTIEAGKQNPRHYHPNCEEYIFVMKGECDHSLGDETVHLRAGDMLRIPQNAWHHAVNTGSTPVEMVIVYSSPDRQTVGEGL